MKKRLVSIVVGLLVLGMGGNVWAGNVVAADLNCTNPAGCVQTNEISDGAVTEPKLATGAVTNGKIADGAVTNSKLADWSVSGSKIVDFSITDTKISSSAVSTEKIADGAVTDAKIVGPISGAKLGSHTHNGSDIDEGSVSTSKIGDGAITDAKITGPISASKLEKPANVVIVAKSGGDFTSIPAALAAINPTADNPYVIKVMPGIYQVYWDGVDQQYNAGIEMKSYVHLQGSGRDVTTIEGVWNIGTKILCSSVTHATISGFTFKGSKYGGLGTVKAITVVNSSYITIEDNHFVGPLAPAIVDADPASTTVVRGNRFTNLTWQDWTGGDTGVQIGGQAMYANNIFEGNSGYATTALAIYNGSPVIKGNLFTANGGAIAVRGGTPTIKDNIMIGNGTGLSLAEGVVMNNKITGSSGCDVNAPASNAILSYNIFDTLCPGSSYLGKYNLKSDGTDAPTAP